MTLIKKIIDVVVYFCSCAIEEKFAICIPIARICFQQSPAEQIVDTMPECILYIQCRVESIKHIFLYS